MGTDSRRRARAVSRVAPTAHLRLTPRGNAETLEELSFRPLTRADFALIGAWLKQPHVARWWPDPSDPESIEAQYGPVVDGADRAEVFIVQFGSEPIGLIDRYLTRDEPDWQRALAPTGVSLDSAGIDYLIGEPDQVGKGLGTQMIAAFIADTWRRYPEIEAIVVAMQQDNLASWRALQRLGLRRAWAGLLDSDDPSDAGPSYVYTLIRPPAGG